MEKIVVPALTVSFALTDWVVKGLENGTFERVGGVIREVATKKVVGWLREISSANPYQKFTEIENQLGAVQNGLKLTQGMLQLSTAASLLSLGVSVMGFAVITQRLNDLEQRLRETQASVEKINHKIDISFYANFRAALDLAVNAFTMSNAENRRSSALQAVNRFVEAEHIYQELTINEINQKSQIADEYILTLTLAYLSEARCYLELEEYNTALRRIQEGSKVVRSHIHRYVDVLLTSNPAVYLQPQFKGKIDLRRLTRVYKWISPSWNENAVFELQRENLITFSQDPNKWVESLPAAIWDSKVDWAGKAFWEGPKPNIYARLPQVFESIESMVETNERFEVYQEEIQAISRLGIKFDEWSKLYPSKENQPDKAKVMFIIPNYTVEAPVV
jgi:tetratricopeptide (TPR) repeat protein